MSTSSVSKSSPSLFSLPPELRAEIYAYVFPCTSTTRIIQTRYGGLRWLSASPQLFLDVAPALYGREGFATYSRLSGAADIANDFQRHVVKTYGRQNIAWTSYFARRMLKRIEVDINVPTFFFTMETLKERFEAYFSTLHRFPELKRVRIRAHDCSRPADWQMGPHNPYSPGARPNDMAQHHQSICSTVQACVDELRESLSIECELLLIRESAWRSDLPFGYPRPIPYAPDAEVPPSPSLRMSTDPHMGLPATLPSAAGGIFGRGATLISQ